MAKGFDLVNVLLIRLCSFNKHIYLSFKKLQYWWWKKLREWLSSKHSLIMFSFLIDRIGLIHFVAMCTAVIVKALWGFTNCAYLQVHLFIAGVRAFPDGCIENLYRVLCVVVLQPSNTWSYQWKVVAESSKRRLLMWKAGSLNPQTSHTNDL